MAAQSKAATKGRGEVTLRRAGSPLAIVLLLSGCSSIPREQVNSPRRSRSAQIVDRFDHSRLESVLQRFVDEEGLVDYVDLVQHRDDLDAYLNSLADVAVDRLVDPGERKAYWINAYNAITLAGIARHYPTRSIRDLRGFWDRITAHCDGRAVTLDEIEHAILRPLGDPRIHMAINCASVSCPKLWNHAYSGRDLEDQLDLAAQRFLGDPRRNRFDDSQRTADLSMIFSWFADDFDVSPYAGVRGFLRRHAPHLPWPTDEYEIRHLPYDWSLNERRLAH